MKRLVAITLTLVLLIAGATPAIAQVSNQIDTMFNQLGTMSNTTAPGVAMSSNGGVISGGSLSIRNHVMNPQVLNFTPPSLTNSCGGIDLLGGSFSFISKDQLTQYMRQIASQALTYAFDLALKSMCPSCVDEMQKLQKLTQDINGGMLNSCHVAQQLVTMAKDGSNGMYGTQYQQWFAKIYGDSSDLFANSNQGPGQNDPALALTQKNQQVAQQIFGNVLWRSLVDYGVANQLAGGNTGLLEDIMSLTGTVIVCVPGGTIGAGGCSANTPQIAQTRPGEPVSYPIDPTMSLSDLVYGTQDGSIVTRLHCDDSFECLAPSAASDPLFKGFAQKIHDEYLGSDTTSGDLTGGIIGRMLHGGGDPTAQDRAFITNLGDYGGMVFNLAYQNEAAARDFASKYSDAVAVEFMYRLASDVIEAALKAMDQSRRDFNGAAHDMLRKAQARLGEEHRRLQSQHVTNVAMLQEYELQKQILGPPKMPRVSAPRTLQ